MPRVEYYHDPDAPRANSIVVAVTAFVLDDQGRVLLIQRSDMVYGRFLAVHRKLASPSPKR
jgi:hypothetical protein